MAKSTPQPPKGTRDFLPGDVRRRRYVEQVIRDVYESHGFEPLETPSFERLETLLGKYGDEGDQLLFKILLRGEPLVGGVRNAATHLEQPDNLVSGRSGQTAPGAEAMLSDLGLRYDLTVPLARVYARNQSKLGSIFKRYQIQPVWRADTPGKGRYREFVQCDVDIVGSTELLVEAEVMGAASECLKRLGFDAFELRLNHRDLLRAIIEQSGVDPDYSVEAIMAVDKLDKLGAEGVEKILEARGIDAGAREKLLKIVGDSATLDGIESRLGSHDAGREAIAQLREVLRLADATPAAGHAHFDVGLARGLSYYTGCIFEIRVSDLASSLGGGGRYDGLIGMFGRREIPACGISLGFERIIVVMDERDMFPASLRATDLLLAAANPAEIPAALAFATRLRAAGKRVDLHPKPMKPGKLRAAAEKTGVNAAVWLEAGAQDRGSLWRKSTSEVQVGLNADEVVSALEE